MNKLIIIGRLGKDPEVKQAGETTITSFSVAVSEKYKGEESTEWFNCTAFNKLADICGQYLKKGSQVMIEGKLKTDSWDDKTSGEKKYRTGVIVNNMEMLGSKGDTQTPAIVSGSDNGFTPPPAPEDDLPF